MYRIKITNRVGSFLTGRRFKTEKQAFKVAMFHKKADKELAGKGYVNRLGGKIQMLNRYSVVKDKPVKKSGFGLFG